MTSSTPSSGYSNEEISKPYYFETDHVALKENSDYHNLLQTITILEAQRQQAAKDIEKLYQVQEEALADPLSFVEKLQRGKDLQLPSPQDVASLPDIQWDKYTNSTSFSSFGIARHMTRNKKNKNSVETESGADHVYNLKSKLIQGLQPAGPSVSTPTETTGLDSDVIVVRGRTKDGSKNSTFNQLWTDEEQQRLESLLVRFPPEEVESKRWAKIANALGNRTPTQVASRVQKYFVKLAREGLPVPGRMPNLTAYSKKGSSRHNRYNRQYFSSNLLQSYTPPVLMRDDADERSPYYPAPPSFSGDASENTSQRDDSSDEDDYPEDVKNTPEFQELQHLKQVKREKLATQKTAATKHIGYKCDSCGCEPIVGTRWNCMDCPGETSVDLCDNCCDMSFQEGSHDSSHRLQPFKHAIFDSDYMSYTQTDYNYLDPNYMPAS